MDNQIIASSIAELDIPLERDGFLRDLLRQLSGTLQDVVGLEEASGFISIVGQKMGASINDQYQDALKVENLNRAQVSAVLADLKQRIHGDFHVISEDDEKIVLQGNSCPFEEKVKDRPSLCMMTSNVLGTIAAENLGYAKVSLEETIATGASACQVVIYLTETNDSMIASGIEYFKE
jgi:predicted ArsR family transcriptional regulator